MTQREILEELKKLGITERLTIIEAASQLIRDELQQPAQPPTRTERRQQMEKAAELLLPDYSSHGELTIFTTLDGEEFHA